MLSRLPSSIKLIKRHKKVPEEPGRKKGRKAKSNKKLKLRFFFGATGPRFDETRQIVFSLILSSGSFKAPKM